MKKYLFGLGAMLIGAGLMFVFTHAEVSAESTKEINCQLLRDRDTQHTNKKRKGVLSFRYEYCHIKDLTCVSTIDSNSVGISCVKSGGIFK